jgi:hypothetical protein
MHKHGSALFDFGTPKGVIRRVTGAVEYVEGSERIDGSRCSRCERRGRRRGFEERMDARVCGGPGTIVEDAARDVAGEEAGVERRTEGLPCHGRHVLCEAAEGIVLGWEVEKEGLWRETRGPPKTIRGSGKAGAMPVLVEGMIDERIAGRVVGKTTREGMEELHG